MTNDSDESFNFSLVVFSISGCCFFGFYMYNNFQQNLIQEFTKIRFEIQHEVESDIYHVYSQLEMYNNSKC